MEKRPFWQSATKIVLLVLTGTVTLGLFLGVVKEETVKELALMAFSFYFGQKSLSSSEK
jgi:hypothetical protein